MVVIMVVKEAFLPLSCLLYPGLYVLCSGFFTLPPPPCSFPSSALLLGYHEDREDRGWMLKVQSVEQEGPKESMGGLLSLPLKQFILLKRKVLWKWSQAIKEYKLFHCVQRYIFIVSSVALLVSWQIRVSFFHSIMFFQLQSYSCFVYSDTWLGVKIIL